MKRKKKNPPVSQRKEKMDGKTWAIRILSGLIVLVLIGGIVLSAFAV